MTGQTQVPRDERDAAVVSDASSGFGTTQERRFYTDERVFSLEQEHLFRKQWILAGRSGEIPSHGDYVTLDVLGEPIVVIRQKDGTVRAFVNSCLHRYTKLLQDKGCRTRFSCPYHAWTYGCDGTLVAAPGMNAVLSQEGFARSLHRLPCKEWNGFVFVSLAADAVFPTELEALDIFMRNYRLSRHVDCLVTEETIACNWKILVENFIESYHLPVLHGPGIGAATPLDQMVWYPANDAYTLHVCPSGDLQKKIVHARELTETECGQFVDACVFPSALIGLYGDMLWWLSVLPVTVSSTCLRWGVSVSEAARRDTPDFERWFAAELDAIRQTLAEDRMGCLLVQAGVGARVPGAGPLHATERSILDLHRYILARIGTQAACFGHPGDRR